MKDRVFIDSNKQLIAKGISLDFGSTISVQVVNEVSNNLLKNLYLAIVRLNSLLIVVTKDMR